jgi:hypothetical protein
MYDHGVQGNLAKRAALLVLLLAMESGSEY